MKSLTVKWMLSIVILMVLLLSAIFLANTFFLEKYYFFKTKDKFLQNYQFLKQSYQKADDRFLELLRATNLATGYKFVVVDDTNTVLLSTVPEFRIGSSSGGGSPISGGGPNPIGGGPNPISGGGVNRNSSGGLNKDETDFLNEQREKLKTGEVIYTTLRREKTEQYDVILGVSLEPDKYLLITQPMEQLRENTVIANDFLLIIGSVLLFLAVLTAYFLSKKTVKPILQITKIAAGIAELDFSKRYRGTSRDEIRTLGDSINFISEKLSSTIHDLTETNNKLQKEMQLQKHFIMSVSHEFKTPVGLIRGYAESIQLGMAGSPEELAEFSKIIVYEADRLTRLIEDIILLARLDSSNFHIKKHDFDISKTIGILCNNFSSLFKEKKVELSLQLPPHCDIHADEERIIQVLENLIRNAMDNMGESGSLRISLEEEVGNINIQIFNTGKQIPPEYLQMIFDPFSIKEIGKFRKKGSTGLGLSIVKSIIEKHSGSCEIQNRENGVVVAFKIPTITER